MNIMHEFSHPIWVKTPLGEGLAIMVIDYGIHLNSCWVVAFEQHEWRVNYFDSNDIKLNRNDTWKIQ